VLSNGKRCPNEALPGSRYCGLPAHQELALQDGNGSEPADVPAVAENAASVAVEPGEVVAEAGGNGTEEPAAVELDEAPRLAEVKQVPTGAPVEETSGDGETEEHPPAA
jgi:N utilization substance protein A